MIKINLLDNIVNKHKNYICFQSNIKEELEKVLLTPFFNQKYLNRLLDLKVKDTYKNELINNLKQDLRTELLKRDRGISELEYLNKESIKFIKFLLANIRGIEKKDLNECAKNNNLCHNIFLAKPKELNWIQKNVIEKYHRLIYIILQLEVYINIKNEKDIKKKYSDLILMKLGYEKFSTKEIKVFYIDEYKFLLGISNKRFYNEYLIKYNIVEKKGKSVSVDTLNEIKEKLKYEIEDINRKSDKNNKYKEIMRRLYNEIDNIQLKKNDGQSIGKYEFINNINSKANGILRYIDIQKISKEKAINIFNISDYNNVINQSWSAYQFLMELGIQTCPYCNRQYITPIYSSKGKVRADLDHFLPKYRFPYFSMSIYNLVPSCKFCNSSLKGITDFTYENNANPYEYGYDNILKFTYIIDSYESLISEDKIEIKLQAHTYNDNEKELLNKLKNNAEVFQVENLYNYHKKEIVDLIRKRVIYTPQYIESLRKQHKNLFKNQNEVLEFIIGNYLDIKDLDKKPLSKLIKDIFEELDFLNTNVYDRNLIKLENILKNIE